MNKIKLLMPILGISATAATAIPLASCSCNKTAAVSLTSIEIKTPATTTDFEVGETFNSTGLVITAKYSDNTSKEVTSGSAGLTTDYDKKTFAATDVGSEKVVTVSYKDNDTTKTTTYKINVNEQSVKKTLIPSSSESVIGDACYGLGNNSSKLEDYMMDFVKNKKYTFTTELVDGYLPSHDPEASNRYFSFRMMTDDGSYVFNFMEEDSIVATVNGESTSISIVSAGEGYNVSINFDNPSSLKAGDIVKLTFSFPLDDQTNLVPLISFRNS